MKKIASKQTKKTNLTPKQFDFNFTDDEAGKVTELLLAYNEIASGQSNVPVSQLHDRAKELTRSMSPQVLPYILARFKDLDYCWGRT